MKACAGLPCGAADCREGSPGATPSHAMLPSPPKNCVWLTPVTVSPRATEPAWTVIRFGHPNYRNTT